MHSRYNKCTREILGGNITTDIIIGDMGIRSSTIGSQVWI